MKRKTIISLALAAGLLLIGAVAYGGSNGYGDQGYYARGCIYGQGYGRAYGVVYNKTMDHPQARTYEPCYGCRHGGRYLSTYDKNRGYANRWNRCRWFGRMGPRGWW
jgi:hypothetical protein